MIRSLNTKADLAIDVTVFIGLTDYGQIMIGDHGFEFYHTEDPRESTQIPWEEADYVLVSVMFKGKWIPRYAIQAKKNGTYTFASKEPKRMLQVIYEYVDSDHMVQSLSPLDVTERGILSVGERKK